MLLLVFIMCCTLFGQSASPKVKWQGLSGKDNEFFFLIPEGFQIFDDDEIYIGRKPDYVRVKDKRTVARYINGVVLMTEFYEGNVKEIQPVLADIQKADLIKEGAFGDFQFKSYVKKLPEYIWEQQYFFNKNRLYVLNVIYRETNNDISQNFFKSVRLLSQGKITAPNFPVDVKKEMLSMPPKAIIEQSSDLAEVQSQPDKEALIIYRPKPSYKTQFGPSNSGTVKLKVLLLPSGKIGKIEKIANLNTNLVEGVLDSAKHLIFLPAEKNGKPVASWKTIQYGFQTTTYIN